MAAIAECASSPRFCEPLVHYHGLKFEPAMVVMAAAPQPLEPEHWPSCRTQTRYRSHHELLIDTPMLQTGSGSCLLTKIAYNGSAAAVSSPGCTTQKIRSDFLSTKKGMLSIKIRRTQYHSKYVRGSLPRLRQCGLI